MFGWFVRKLRGTGSAKIVYRPRDCHCHIVPGVDDGSRTLSESVEMLNLLRADGAQVVIATPHIFPGKFPNREDDLKRRFEQLVAAANGLVELELGAEYYVCQTLANRLEEPLLCFGEEKYVLFEAHTGQQVPVDLLPVAYGLLDRGYTPLLAHPERYHWLRGDEGSELCADLQAAGVRFQVNRTIGKLNRIDHRARGRFLAMLIEHGWVDEVGSDLHRPTPTGRPYSPNELAGHTRTADQQR